jgi:ribosome maturation protein Sdo1
MSQRTFQTARKLVDRYIWQHALQVSPEERNRMVQAAEFKLKQGVSPSDIDPRSTLTHVSFNIDEIIQRANGTSPQPTQEAEKSASNKESEKNQ